MNISRWTRRAPLIARDARRRRLALAAQGVTTGAITRHRHRSLQARPSRARKSRSSIALLASAPRRHALERPLLRARPRGRWPVYRSRSPHRLRAGRADDVIVSLSQTTRVDIKLNARRHAARRRRESSRAARRPNQPDEARRRARRSPTRSISRIPILNRNFTDLAKLTPQVTRTCNESRRDIDSSATYSCGASAGGQYNRYNNFTIDGANQNDRFNLAASGGLPGAAGGGRIISPDAVKEFRVLLSPTDVRQANFTGMLVNAVTKSGTNEFHGGAIYDFRNENLSAVELPQARPSTSSSTASSSAARSSRTGSSSSSPPSGSSASTAAAGAFVGQAAGIDRDDAEHLAGLDRATCRASSSRRWASIPGPSGRVDIDNPLTNLFGRLDFQINDVHRLVLPPADQPDREPRPSRATATRSETTRSLQNTGFRLGSNSSTASTRNNSTVAQLYSNFQRGISNEFIFGFNRFAICATCRHDHARDVASASSGRRDGTAATNPTAAITFGSEQFSVGNRSKQDIIELQDNVSDPVRRAHGHVRRRYEHLKVYDNFAQAARRRLGLPEHRRAQQPAAEWLPRRVREQRRPDDIPAAFKTDMKSLYAQDQWA